MKPLSKIPFLVQQHRKIWYQKPALRKIYASWYQEMLKHLKKSPKPIIEVGGGTGNLKEFYPQVISTDLTWGHWLDLVSDAHHLPFRSQSISNIIMVDVLHHLTAPITFFRNALRILEPGGRIIMLEPYISPISWVCYSLLHQEEVRFCEDIFDRKVDSKKDPFVGNGAIPTILFWKQRSRFCEAVRTYRIIAQVKLCLFVYPLSGGFKSWSFMPCGCVAFLLRVEEKLSWLRPLLAFRCLVVLEKCLATS